MQNKTFRLFISSPFSDFAKEREVLHMRVFPKVSKHCELMGYTFHPVDLRWGVSHEAQLDQKTLEVCLEEVRACKHFMHPNFLILAGDRYGYVPCPYMIEEKEFDEILHTYSKDSEALQTIKKWYKLDKNQIPTSYVLQVRVSPYDKYENWEKEESLLRTALQEAVKKLLKNKVIFNNEEDAEYQKYFLSATEQEAIEGICVFQDKKESQVDCDEEIDKKYIYGYTRTIKNSTPTFEDKDENLKVQVKKFKSNLIAILDTKENNLYKVHYDSMQSYDDDTLEGFEKYITAKLIKSIDEQKENQQNLSVLEQEVEEQKLFQKEKLKGFQGREKILKQITAYIDVTSESLL